MRKSHQKGHSGDRGESSRGNRGRTTEMGGSASLGLYALRKGRGGTGRPAKTTQEQAEETPREDSDTT